MNDPENCILCESLLGSDFTILGSQNYLETLSFLKGVPLDLKKYKVCLICFEKLNFISSFRSQKKPEPQIETGSNVSVGHSSSILGLLELTVRIKFEMCGAQQKALLAPYPYKL